jgi:hypothetical protein
LGAAFIINGSSGKGIELIELRDTFYISPPTKLILGEYSSTVGLGRACKLEVAPVLGTLVD